MSVNKKGKLFGLFNIVDIIIVIVILAVGIVGFNVIRSKNEIVAAGGTKTITYVVEAQNIVSEAAEAPKIGDKIYNSSTSDYLGVLVKYDVINQTRIDYNIITGAYEKHEIPDSKTVYATIEGEGYDNDSDIMVNGTSVKVGLNLNIKGKGYAFGGYVVDITLSVKE